MYVRYEYRPLVPDSSFPFPLTYPHRCLRAGTRSLHDLPTTFLAITSCSPELSLTLHPRIQTSSGVSGRIYASNFGGPGPLLTCAVIRSAGVLAVNIPSTP